VIAGESSSDDDSMVNEGVEEQSTPERERARIPSAQQPLIAHSDTSSTGSARETPPQQRLARPSHQHHQTR
jgi:hypothetical protein